MDGLAGDHVVFDVARHAFVSEAVEAPPSVHPGLWRQAGLNVNHGLFEVADGVWQVRGYDLANITFIAGADGWLIIDPLTNAPAAAGRPCPGQPNVGGATGHLDHLHPLPRRPLRRGSGGSPVRKRLTLVTCRSSPPEGFLDEVVGEFVIAGPIMGRRAAYQFGTAARTWPSGPRRLRAWFGHGSCPLRPDRAHHRRDRDRSGDGAQRHQGRVPDDPPTPRLRPK